MWNAIIGHGKPVAQLKKVIADRQFPPAYLFCGHKGIGKSLVARLFAQAVFCEKSPQICDVCAPCTKIKNHRHPDVFFVEPKTSRILIEQIRQLQQDIQFHPLEGGFKLALIDEADTMTEAAANSLLKTLEEPPTGTHFILICAFPHRLLPTIRSRCRNIVFSPLTDKEVAAYLKDRLSIDEAAARRLAALSQGSIGAVEGWDAEFAKEVRERFVHLVGKANTADIISTAETWSREEEQAPLIFDLLASFYRDILYQRLTGTDRYLIHSSCLVLSRPPDRLVDDFLAIMRARDTFSNTTANKQLLFEQLLFRLTS